MAGLTQALLRPQFSLMLLAPTFLMKYKKPSVSLQPLVLIICLWVMLAQPVDSNLQIMLVMHLAAKQVFTPWLSKYTLWSRLLSAGIKMNQSSDADCWGQGATNPVIAICLCRLLQESQLHWKPLLIKADMYFVCNTQWKCTINASLPSEFLWRGSAMITHHYIKAILTVPRLFSC